MKSVYLPSVHLLDLATLNKERKHTQENPLELIFFAAFVNSDCEVGVRTFRSPWGISVPSELGACSNVMSF